MGAMSRNKGASAERELARILSDELGADVTRNLIQTRDGGHDLDGLGKWRLEVKRHKQAAPSDIKRWWVQAVGQAQAPPFRESQRVPGNKVCAEPALAYRVDRGEWRFVVPSWNLFGSDYAGHWGAYGYEWTAEIGLLPFCQLVRESL